jgi:hypothetical protein
MNIAPRFMLCAVAIACVAPAALGNHYILPCDNDCRDGTPIQPGMTGAWGVPGQGTFDFIVEVLPGQPLVLSVAWLTFAPEGGPTWIVARGPVNGNHASLTAYRGVTGSGQFPANPDSTSSQIESWGTLDFIFGNCNFGHVDWTRVVGSFASGGTDIVRLTQAAGLDCKQGSTAQSAPGDMPGANVQSAPAAPQQP